jgi:monoterpene epsilon-lactone hydrolase
MPPIERTMARATPPVPSSVSEQAQRFLATATNLGAGPEPAQGDVDAWLQRVKEGDAYIMELIGRIEFPVHVEDTEIAGVHTFVIRADGVPDDSSTPIYLDIHGGALIMGGGEVCRLMASAMAISTGMIHWAVDYRMPPRHPYPAPLDDCIAVYRALLEQRAPDDIFVGGGSAGGNLAAALVARAKDEGLPMPT